MFVNFEVPSTHEFTPASTCNNVHVMNCFTLSCNNPVTYEITFPWTSNTNEFINRMKYRCYLPTCKTDHPSTCNFMYIKSDIAVFIWKDLILIDDINTMYNYEYNAMYMIKEINILFLFEN